MLSNIKLTLKTTIIYSLGNLSSKLVGFILIPLYTSHLATQEYGIYGILEAISQISIALLGLGLYTAFYRWYWDKEFADKKKSMFFTVIVFVALFSVALVFLLSRFSLQSSLFLFDTSQYRYLINIMLVNTALEAVLIIPATLLRLQQKAIQYSSTYLVKFLTIMALSVYFIKYQNHKVEGIYEAQIIGNLIYFLILLKFIIKNIEFKFSTFLLKGMLKYSIPLIFSSIISVLLTMTDRFAIKFLGTLSDVGIYSLGFKAANTIKVLIVASLNMAIWPIIFKMMDDPKNKRFYSKLMTYITYFVAMIVIGVSFFGKEIIKVLAKNVDYWEAYKIIPIISFSILFGMLKDISLIGLHITKKTRIIATLIFYTFIINLILNVGFISLFGIMGAAISTCLAQIILFIMVYNKSQKEYFIPFEIRKILVIIIVSIVLMLLSTLSNNLHVLLRIIIKTLLLVSFPIILYFLNFYEEVEIDRIKKGWIIWRNPFNWKNNLQRLKN